MRKNMRAILNTAIKVARQTSNQLVRSFDQLAGPVEQASQEEMITRIQEQCFLEMKEEIQKARPEHEVQMADQKIDITKASEWLMMPLVGADNFMAHNPNFFVALAYYEYGQAKVSVIYDCLRNDLVTAVSGEGAKYSNKKMRVSTIIKTEGIRLASQCPVGDVENRQKQWAQFYLKTASLASSLDCQSIGLLGVMQLVSSQVDAFVSYQIDLVTLQIGGLILKEAGALTTDYKGGEAMVETRTLMAANSKLIRELLQISRG
jgi:myo-inositol-1(or 4)-monophosphatase